jgi:hypothetical protein
MVKKQNSTECLDTWLEMDLYTEATKSRIIDADIILVPDIGKIDGIPKAFKPDTKTFYKFALKNNLFEKKIEILENEGELTVLNFHSHEIWLPNLYIKDMNLLPIIMDIVNRYVDEKKVRIGDDVVVNFNIKIQKSNGTCDAISFKGSMDDLNKSILKI